MPALPDTPSGVIRIRLIHQQPNDDHVGCAFDMAYSGGAPSTSDLATLAGNVSADWDAQLKPFLSANALLYSVVCIDLANTSTPEGSIFPAIAGTRAGNSVPNSICAVLGFSIDRRYRGARPKVFLPFGTESDQSSSTTWLTAFVEDLKTAWDTFQGLITTTIVSATVLGAPVGVSYYEGKIPNPNPGARMRFLPAPRAVPAIYAVTATAVLPRFGSQRRRLTAA